MSPGVDSRDLPYQPGERDEPESPASSTTKVSETSADPGRPPRQLPRNCTLQVHQGLGGPLGLLVWPLLLHTTIAE
jgi:hypothetical protein